MILHDLTGGESSPVYQSLEISNGNRHYDFLRSIIEASLETGRPFLSQAIIKALNFHAITCLHTHAGEYRPCPVIVGNYEPPQHYQVQSLMDEFVNQVNRMWEKTDPVTMAAYVLWRINSIHPFINGNGRTARATAYFVICVTAGGWLPGHPIVPELLRSSRRDDYIAALKVADDSSAKGQLDLSQLHEIFSDLLSEQLESAGVDVSGASNPDVADS